MTKQQCYQYSFIGLLCLGLLIQNYIFVRRYGHRTLSGMYFRLFILTAIVSSVLVVVCGLREAHLFGYNTVFAYGEEILYTLSAVFGGYFWFITSELYQESGFAATRKRRIILAIPLIIMTVVTVLNPIHHMCFRFEDGHYVRESLSVVISLVLIAFIMATGTMAFVRSFMKKYYLERTYLRIIFLYAFLLMTFQSIQLVIGSVMPFFLMGEVLVIYIIQQKYILDNIYIDRLTGANNRNAAEKHLGYHVKYMTGDVFIAIIDADHFKAINDTYGHQAGDLALQLLAKAFMKNLNGDDFFARYGGDEFLLVSLSGDCLGLEKVVEKARESLKEMCMQRNVEFDLDFSCGIVKKTPEMETIPDIIAAADEEMYRVKAERRTAVK